MRHSRLNFFNPSFSQLKNRKNQVSKFHEVKNGLYIPLIVENYETFHETFMKPHETLQLLKQTFRFHKSFMSNTFKYLFFIGLLFRLILMKPHETFKSFMKNNLRRLLNLDYYKNSAYETFFLVVCVKNSFFYNCKNFRLGKNIILLKNIR